MREKRIVISEIGTLSVLGTDLESVGRSLLSPPEPGNFQTTEFHSFDNPIPCFTLKDFDTISILGKKGMRNRDNITKIVMCAAELGFKNYMESLPEEKRPGFCIGTSLGGLESIGDFLSDSIVNGVNAVNPQAFANTVINAPTGNVNIRYIARNLSTTISTGFNSSLDAIIYTFDFIRRGYCDAIIAGGVEEISYYSLLGFMRSGLVATSCKAKPFSESSEGVILGEGCALFLIETVDSVVKRGAKAYVEIVGCASGFNPDIKSSSPIFKKVIENACEQAGIKPSDIDLVASGGSGNRLSDLLEANGIAETFGSTVPVTAYKRFYGECSCASGALNILCTICDIHDKRISGIRDEKYPPLKGINLVFGTVSSEINYAIVTSYSCDGNCSAVVLKNIKDL
ncbi:MAG: hypothetical protein N2053_04795 [Chitinispirillaceae bacterium]|nr:hypothetical protein [Chitinispirillaceae bacterium]